MRNLSVCVGLTLLLMSAGPRAAVWDAYDPATGGVWSPDAQGWPLQVSTAVFPLGDTPVTGGAADGSSLVLDYVFAAAWKLSEPDGRVWEQEVSWSGVLEWAGGVGSGWGITTTLKAPLGPGNFTGAPAPVPAPAAGLLFPVGLGMLERVRRRRARRHGTLPAPAV